MGSNPTCPPFSVKPVSPENNSKPGKSRKLATVATPAVLYRVPERDENEEGGPKCRKADGSGPVNGEDLLAPEELREELRKAKKALESEP